jgi:hypothetical protein
MIRLGRMPDLAGALETCLPGLHRDPIGMRKAQLPHLLRADHPVAPRDRCGEAVEHRRLARLGPAGDQDVETRAHAGLQEGGGGRGQAAELDQVSQARGAQGELADVDRREAPRDAVEDHVEPVTAGHGRVDERRRAIEPAPGGLEHPLHQLVDLLRRQHQVGQLVSATPRDEDPRRVVDPDLLHLRIVEEALQRPEPGDARDQLGHHRVRVGDRRDRTGQ